MSYFDQESIKKQDNAAAENYLEETNGEYAENAVVGNNEEGSEYLGLGWTGQMGVAISDAQYFDSVEEALLTYPRLGKLLKFKLVPEAGILICKITLKNINATTGLKDTPSLFDMSICWIRAFQCRYRIYSL